MTADRHPAASRPGARSRRQHGRRLGRTILSRLGQMLVVALAVVCVTFALVHLAPGDPALTILGQHATPETIAALHHRMHLDQPLATQFSEYLRDTATGNLGTSILPGSRSVSDSVLPALRVTASLTAVAVLISLLLGIPLGVIAGVRGGAIDIAVRAALTTLLAFPSFFIAFLLLILALNTGIAPAGGWSHGFVGKAQHIWLPALALAAYLTPVIARALRQSVVETMEQDFIDAAISRGVRGPRLILRHVLPNSLLPVVTLVGYNIGALIAGAVVIEAIFNLPGLGSTLQYAVANRDYPVVQATALVTAFLVVAANALADVAYLVVDPRTRS